MPHDRPHQFRRDADTVLRDVEATRLRAQHLTFQQIADALGMGNKSTAKRAVDRVLTRVQVEAAEELRAVEFAVLLAVRQRLVKILYAAHVHVSDGRVVRDETGEPILDDGPAIAAARELRGNSESIRKLLGLDAPATATLTVINEDALDAAIRELEANLADGPRPDSATGEDPALPAAES